jgi:death-on-curing protein
MTLSGELVYKTPFQRAAAIAHGIARGHPFNDGNHRTALAAAHIVLGLSEPPMIITAADDDQKDAIMRLGSGALILEDYSAWLERWSARRSGPP